PTPAAHPLPLHDALPIRADHTAGRRRDTVWVPPQLGVPTRVERVLERREPARRDPTFVAEAAYDLSSQLRYPGRLFEERQEEIVDRKSTRLNSSHQIISS